MRAQHFRTLDQQVVQRFLAKRRSFGPDVPRLRLAWSNWTFGRERLEISAVRLARYGVRFIELHGNLYGPDLGYKASDVRRVLDGEGLAVSGICGIVSPEQELASNLPSVRQRAIDYFRRQADFCRDVNGTYVMFGAGAVGRPLKYDGNEMARAADTIQIIGEYFADVGVRGAVEPIRPEEVSLVHTFAECMELLSLAESPGVQHISGDLYHMLSGEEHIGRTILDYGEPMINLQLADTNRRGLGQGLLDLDIVLMALYSVGYNTDVKYASAEPLGPGGNPYQAMHGEPDPAALDALVSVTAATFYEREEEVLSASEEDIGRYYGLG